MPDLFYSAQDDFGGKIIKMTQGELPLCAQGLSGKQAV
jgi:hypothetical protein